LGAQEISLNVLKRNHLSRSDYLSIVRSLEIKPPNQFNWLSSVAIPVQPAIGIQIEELDAAERHQAGALGNTLFVLQLEKISPQFIPSELVRRAAFVVCGRAGGQRADTLPGSSLHIREAAGPRSFVLVKQSWLYFLIDSDLSYRIYSAIVAPLWLNMFDKPGFSSTTF